MGKLTTLVGKFSARGKDKQPPPEQIERQDNSPRVEHQKAAESQQGGNTAARPVANGRQGGAAELSEDSDRGEAYHDVAAFGSDVSTEFKREVQNTYSGELDGLVVTRPAFQSMVFQRPKSPVGRAKVCASCQKEADPRHPGSLFTAECGHTFHFECIALGLDLGHLRCPLCRKTWRRLPDTGAWANGTLGFTYQGQPVKHRNGGNSGAPRPPRNARRLSPPLPDAHDDDLDLDDIPIAPIVRSPDSHLDPLLNQSPETTPSGTGPREDFALDRPPTFRTLLEATPSGTGPSEAPRRGGWAKRSKPQMSVDTEAEPLSGDPFDFHQKSPEASQRELADLPSPVALKRGGDFAKRREGVVEREPEFDFGVNAQSAPLATEVPGQAFPISSTVSSLHIGTGANAPPQPSNLRVQTVVNASPQPPNLRVDTRPNALPPPPNPSVNGPPAFSRRRRTSKDSAPSPLPSIIETSSPDSKRLPPGRRTPPASPRRRYERRQASNPEGAAGSPRLKNESPNGSPNTSPPGEERRAESRGVGEGMKRIGGLKPPPGRGNLTPPPGSVARLQASKQEEQDWAKFFAPSTQIEPSRSWPADGDSRAWTASSGDRGLGARPSEEAYDLRSEDSLDNQGQGSRTLGSGCNPAPKSGSWKQTNGPPQLPEFASHAKGLKVLGVSSDAEGENFGPVADSRVGDLSSEPSRGSASPVEPSRPSRGFEAPGNAEPRLESLRTSVPPVDGTWSSMDEKDIRVDANSKIVYSNALDRPKRAADSRGWFFNSEFGTDGISELLRGVEANRVVNQPEAWEHSTGHQFAGSLQGDAGFDMGKFEAAIGPEVFDDDDPVAPLQPLPGNAPDLEISVRSEYPAVAAGESRDKLLCLVTVKAPPLVKASASSPDHSSHSLPNSRSGNANSHHARRSSDGARSFDSGVLGPTAPRSRNGSRGSIELEDLRGFGASDVLWTGRSGLQRAGSADVALLEKRDSADLDGWLTEQLTERLRLKESACPISDAMDSVPAALEEARAPLDLVAVLDVSKSMMGRKLRLVQKTIHFVTQNLGPNDRLSVVAFSKKAYRVTPLMRITERGREQTIAAVKRIEVSSGTNIGAGLRMGLKVLKDARTRNPVRAVVLLSDGQDSWGRREMSLLLPEWGVTDWHGVAVHTFGFGGDHDAEAMYSVASESKGTYSFIKKTEGVQDAFARCIGGLLTVVAQDVTLSLEMGGGNRDRNGCRIQNLHAGLFERTVDEAGTRAEIVLGDIYAEEERDILVELSLPPFDGTTGRSDLNGGRRQLVLEASGSYVQARTQLIKAVTPVELLINRPLEVPPREGAVDISVDRQRNRLLATRAMSTAREWAELGQLGAAQRMLESAITQIGQSAAFANGDPLTLQLDHDLRECAVGFASMDEFEERGRAYSMSQGLSHATQRASTSTFRRGSRAASGGYSTSTMETMINRSQVFEIRR